MADTSTVIGETILVRGNLQGDEDLTVQGRVEGSTNLSRTLIVEPNGIVKAEVSVSNAVVSGVVVGNVTASDSVEIAESGRMIGDIHAPRVIIVEGARFKGKVDMGNIKEGRAPAAPQRPTAYRPAVSKPQPTPRPVATPAKKPVVKPATARAAGKSAASKAKPTRKKKKVVVKKRR